MTYEPKEWKSGDEITANALNNIEGGVADVNADFTPKTWSCGDTITADELNRIEQGIANASDGEGVKNKTLTMTIVNDSDATNLMSIVTYVIEDGIVKSADEPFPQPNTSEVITSLIVPDEVAGASIGLPALPASTQGTYSYVSNNEINCELQATLFGSAVVITDINSDASITVTLIFSESGGGGGGGAA